MSGSAMDWTAQPGSAAAEYEAFFVPVMFVPLAARLLDEVGVQEGDRLLDVACGTGCVTRAAIRRGARVTGADLGAPMLEVARRTAPEAEFVEASATALPVGDGAFDVVTCQQGLQFFDDRPAALAEMRRALAPGGRVAVATWTGVSDQPHFAALTAALDRHLGREFGDILRAPFVLADPAELAGLLEAAGFPDPRVERVTIETVYETAADFAPRAVAAGPAAAPFTAADPEVQAAITRDVAEALRGRTLDDGRLASEMTTLLAVASAP